MSTIQREGLPLPIFVRFDDIEYGLRCHPKFITMSGICVWHLAFHPRYNAAVERYQITRNGFIAQFTSNIAPRTNFMTELHHNIQLELKKFNYTDAELVLDGFEDFLKGPSFISERVAEARFEDANRNKEHLVSFESLADMTRDLSGLDLDRITPQEIDADAPRSRLQALYDFVTCNGQRTPFAEKDQGIR